MSRLKYVLQLTGGAQHMVFLDSYQFAVYVNDVRDDTEILLKIILNKLSSHVICYQNIPI